MFGVWWLPAIILVQLPIFSDQNFQTGSKVLLQSLKYKIEEVLDVDDTQCSNDLKIVLNDAMSLKRWALEMVDASSKPSSGLLAGNKFMLGNFDQCINLVSDDSSINGEYCTSVITPRLADIDPHNLTEFLAKVKHNFTSAILEAPMFIYGICVPHSCSAQNLQLLWNYAERIFDLPFHMIFHDIMCTNKHDPISPFEIDRYIIGFIKLYLVILVLSTFYDIFVKDKTDSIWLCFSLYSNAKKIFVVKNVAPEDDYITSINGIKVISTLLVIYAHRISMNFFAIDNGLQVNSEWKVKLSTTIPLSATMAVDTFFLTSGLLLSYGILKAQDLKGLKRIPLFSFYFFRILRLTPALLALLVFSISIFKNVGDGPAWPSLGGSSSKTCLKFWYGPLFYIVNQMEIERQCLPHTWYISADTQLYLISPVILTFLLKVPVITCLACAVISIAAGIYTYIITIQNNYAAAFCQFDLFYFQRVVQPTLVRMPPWLLGYIFGYVIYKYKNTVIPKVTRTILKSAVFLTMFLLILSHLAFSRIPYNAVYAGLFNGGAKQLWSVAMGVLVLLCATEKNDRVTKFLSHWIFQILAKISYSVYLLHLMIIIYFNGTKRSTAHFSDMTNLHEYAGDLCFIFIFSTMWCLAFESPFIAIGRRLLRKESSKHINSYHKVPTEEVTMTNRKQNLHIKQNGNIEKIE